MEDRIKVLIDLARCRKTEVASIVIKFCEENDLESLLKYKLPGSHLLRDYYFPRKGESRSDCRARVLRDFRHDYFLTTTLKRCVFKGVKTQEEMEKDAYDSFIMNENKCKKANLNLQLNSNGLVPIVAENLAKILGRFNPKIVVEGFGHGPGSSFSQSIQGCTHVSKFSRLPYVTSKLEPFSRSIMGERWWLAHAKSEDWFDSAGIPMLPCNEDDAVSTLCITDCNEFITVPKTSLKLRPICIEPSLNLFFQKGVGFAMSRRLTRSGNDIKTGQERNRNLVSMCVKKNLCTIDLSAASDTISFGVVRMLMLRKKSLLPWLHAMELGRSPNTMIKNPYSGEIEFHKLYKLSSMGNGFTFEFETALFLSIVRAIVPQDKWDLCSTYGDDIICPREYGSKVVEALETFGFTINSDKTFLSGLFFESCGHDYFDDQYVRPPLIPEGKSDDVSHVVSWKIRFANALRLYSCAIADWTKSDRSSPGSDFDTSAGFVRLSTFLENEVNRPYCASVYKSAYNKLIREEITDVPLIPPSLGDSGLVVPISSARPVRASDWIEGYDVMYLSATMPKTEIWSDFLSIYQLHDLSSPVHSDFYRLNAVHLESSSFTMRKKLYQWIDTRKQRKPEQKEKSAHVKALLRLGYQVKRQRVLVPTWDDNLVWGSKY